jgi:chromate reductase
MLSGVPVREQARDTFEMRAATFDIGKRRWLPGKVFSIGASSHPRMSASDRKAEPKKRTGYYDYSTKGLCHVWNENASGPLAMTPEPSRHRVAILVGSLRQESINRKVARSICAFAANKLDCAIVEIGDLALYNQDHDADPPAEYVRFRERIALADGVLFCTPEYNRGVPGVLKNAIDVGSRPYGSNVWDKKPAAIISASPGSIGGFGANHQLRQACVFLNMPMMQQPEAYLGNVTDDKFDESGCLKEGPLKALVLDLAAAFADWVDLIVRSRRFIAEDLAHLQTTKTRAG